MIKTVVRCPDNTVMVFDEKGEQLPRYQGLYEEVREAILRDISIDTIFSHFSNTEPKLRNIPVEQW